MAHESFSLKEQADYNDDWNIARRSGSFDEMPEEVRIQGQRVLDLLLSIGLSKPKILEIGCGTGWLTEKLEAHGECTAIDLGPQAIEMAKKRGLQATFLVGDFLQLDLPIGHFDVCVTVGTISCFEDQAALFEKIATTLRPRGHLILTTNNRFVFERQRNRAEAIPGRVMNWRTPRELRALLRPRFDVLYQTTLFPSGDMGVLRIVNSGKLNRALRLVLPQATIDRAKERLGLGHNILAMARRRD